MADTLSESRACALLARLFEKRGYSIERNVPFRDLGVEFHCDGWDGKAKVGFEFLSSQHDDHDDLSLAEYQTLMDAQQRGRLHLLILDEVETLTVAELTAAANDFLDELARPTVGRARNVAGDRRSTRRTAAAVKAGKTVSAKGTSVRSAGAKPAAGKRVKPTVGTGATARRAASGAASGRAGGGKKVRAAKPAAAGAKGRRGPTPRSERGGR